MAQRNKKPALAETIEKKTGFQFHTAPDNWTLTNNKFQMVGPKAGVFSAIETRTNLGNAAIGEVITKSKLQAMRGAEPILLAADYVSPTQAENLRTAGVQFVDAAGNAFIRNEQVLIYISGQKPETPRKRPFSAFSPAGIELLLAFVNRPELINADYRTIATFTSVTHTTVGRWLAEMERLGFMKRWRDGERELLRRDELISRWTNYYTETFRQKIEPVRFKSRKKTGRWWDEIDAKEYGAVWGGETGGQRLTGHLLPARATIYADTLLPRLQARFGLVRDPAGEFEIVQKFWKFGDLDDVAPPLVVYADLMATADERNIETAAIVYERYLANAKETAS